jgi:hypothetical protein
MACALKTASLLESRLHPLRQRTLTMSFPASVSPVIEGLIRDARTGGDLRIVLDWLATPAGSHAAAEVAALCVHLDLLERTAVEHAARVRILDIFHDRALRASLALKPTLAASALPVEAGLRATASQLCDVNMRLARDYLGALDAGAALRPARASGHAMVCVLDAYALHVLIGADDPKGMWRTANALLPYARTPGAPGYQGTSGTADAEQLYRQLVALALAQPPNLAPADFFNVAEYVRSYSGAVQIQMQPPHRDLDSWYWLDDELDQGPIALLRTPADSERGGHLIFCSCQRLGQVLGQHLDLIDEGGDAGDVHLPACLEERSTRRLMRMLQSRWMAMPRRQHARRTRTQQVLMLIGFEAIWQLLEHRNQSSRLGKPGHSVGGAQRQPGRIFTRSREWSDGSDPPWNASADQGSRVPQLDDLRRPLGAQQSAGPGRSGRRTAQPWRPGCHGRFQRQERRTATPGRRPAAAAAHQPAAASGAHVPLPERLTAATCSSPTHRPHAAGWATPSCRTSTCRRMLSTCSN